MGLVVITDLFYVSQIIKPSRQPWPLVLPGAEMDESDELHCEASFTYEVSIAEKQKYSSTTSMK